MALIKFPSHVESLGIDNSDDAFIDSGASQNFFHRRSAFSNYETISTESVQISHDVSRIFGKGTVKVLLEKDITMQSYYAPEFNTNILASHFFSEAFEVLMSSLRRKENKGLLF